MYNIQIDVKDKIPKEEIQYHINKIKEFFLREERIDITQILPIVYFYYSLPTHGRGGNLHIVLDNGNVDDDHINYCIKCANEEGDELGMYIGKILLQMSKTQRRKIYRSC